MPSPTRKERVFLRREQDILDTALSLFATPDWEQVTVEQIANQADVGKGTIYKHFSCKEEIYARLAVDFHHQLMRDYRGIDATLPFDQIFRSIIKISFERLLGDPSCGHVSFYCKRGRFVERLNPELQSTFMQMQAEFDDFIAGIMAQGIAQGVIPDRPVNQLTAALEATFDGALRMIWNQEVTTRLHMSVDSFLNIVSEFMMVGLVGLKR